MTITMSKEQADLLGELVVEALVEHKLAIEEEAAEKDEEYVAELTEIGNALGANIDWDALRTDAF